MHHVLCDYLNIYLFNIKASFLYYFKAHVFFSSKLYGMDMNMEYL